MYESDVIVFLLYPSDKKEIKIGIKKVDRKKNFTINILNEYIQKFPIEKVYYFASFYDYDKTKEIVHKIKSNHRIFITKSFLSNCFTFSSFDTIFNAIHQELETMADVYNVL